MSNALAIALRAARRYQEGGMVSDEDVARAQLDEQVRQTAPREGGLLQTIPQFYQQMQTPEGRSRLWEATKQEAANFIPGLVSGAIETVKGPGEAMQHGMTPEQETEWAGSTAMNLTGTHMPFAGKGDIGVFGGKGSALADHAALERAEQFEQQGLNPNQIWSRTGWMRDPGTGNWFYHHDMTQAALHPDVPRDRQGRINLPTRMSVGLDELFQHPDLYEAYPFLKDWQVSGEPRRDAWGSIDYRNKFIRLSPQSEEQMLNSLTHEVNHAIQRYEGFSGGSNPNRWLPPNYTRVNKEIQNDIEPIHRWLGLQGLDTEKSFDTLEQAIRNPTERVPERDAFVSRMIDSGRFQDMVSVIHRSDLQDKALRAAHDRYSRAFGEAMSRQAELRRTMTPEQNLQLTIPKGMGEIEQPFPWQQAIFGKESPISYKDLSAKLPESVPRDSLGFYSKADEIVNKGPAKAPADQWMGMLKNSGLKPEEDHYLGISDYLLSHGPTINKADLQNYIRNSRVKLRETVANVHPDADLGALPEEWGGNPPPMWEEEEAGQPTGMEPEQYGMPVHPAEVARHGDRVLPGGDNYREIKLSLPTPASRWDYSHEHFPDDPNNMVYSRVDDRKINGKKTLFINELQSDWHQQGQRYGYHGEDLTGGDIDPEAVPDAPYKKVWPELMFKRLLTHAAQGGYDQIAWAGSPEMIKTIEGWPSINKLEGKYLVGPLNKDFSPIVNRYLRDLPNIADKLGKPHGALTTTVGAGSKAMAVLPITKALRQRALTKGWSDWKKGGRVFARGGKVKVSKAEANYRHGTQKEHCSICTMFRRPNSCTTVEGVIMPMDTCKFFERKGSGRAS